MVRTENAIGVDARLLSRILTEGYGPGAWHGADIKAAIAGVSADGAQTAGARHRHNIAEIALHHAYYVHSVRGRLTSAKPEPFPLAGDDWFVLEAGSGMSWDDVQQVLEEQYASSTGLLSDIGSGKSTVAGRRRWRHSR